MLLQGNVKRTDNSKGINKGEGGKVVETKLKLPSAVSLKGGYNIKKSSNVVNTNKKNNLNINKGLVNENLETSFGENKGKNVNMINPFVKGKIMRTMGDDHNLKTEFTNNYANTNTESELVFSTNTNSKRHEFTRQSNSSLINNNLNNLDVFLTEKTNKDTINRINFHKDINTNFQK